MADASLPAYFPRVAKECKEVSKSFFECFTTESKYEPGAVSKRDEAADACTRAPADDTLVQDAEVGKRALAKCKAQLDAYKQCSEAHLQHRPLVSAPQVYTEQARTGKTE